MSFTTGCRAMNTPDPELLDGGDRMLRLDTLVRLRWLAIVGQSLAVVFVAFGLGFQTPLVETAAVILVAVLLNLALVYGFAANHRFSARTSAIILGLDIIQLSALLFLTGGLQNPFAMLFLAPVMVSAATLPLRNTMLLGLVAYAMASLLAAFHLPLPWQAGTAFVLPEIYVAGVWAAILVSLAFIGVYTWKVAEEARQLSAALAATELVLAREQHLTAIDGLAAAAAHKLGTPLATITVVAKELDLQAEKTHPFKDDIVLLRQEAQRCREILTNITSLGRDEGGPLGEVLLGQLIEEMAAPYRNGEIKIEVTLTGADPQARLTRSPGLVYSIGNLIDNAVGFARSKVVVSGRWTASEIVLSLSDDGPGFTPDVLQRLGDPYVTTRRQRLRETSGRRHTGGGLGLGLFISKTLLERSGARVFWSNDPGTGGAKAEIRWSRQDFLPSNKKQGGDNSG